jgi:hypothetical protein
MRKLNSSGHGSGAAANARMTRQRRRKRRRWKQPWFGLLNRAAREDREERGEPPDLTQEEVLAWADAFLERTGDWPRWDSGPIEEAPGETWLLVAAALALGLRGFPPGGSIPRFLDEHRGRYNPANPKFTVEKVLAWADAWFERTGDWPVIVSGDIPGSGGINWKIVDCVLRFGRGMVPGGSSLCHFLADRRGVVRHPRLTEEQILAWADAHHRQTGKWPIIEWGPITEAPEETWFAIHSALCKGFRGLPGGSSLPDLLVRRRQARISHYAPRLTIPQVLAWADAFHARTGRWPTCTSGPILEAPGELWGSVISAVYEGHRGLPGGTTLTQILIEHRGIRSKGYAPPLLIPQILAWADAFHACTGKWPTQQSGTVTEAPGEKWLGIENALSRGLRGLPGGSSLARLFAQERGTHYARDVRSITIADILRWADGYKEHHGKWPNVDSGPIPESPGETWRSVQNDLQVGRRGLPARSSIQRLLADHRGRRHIRRLPDLTIGQILAWIDAYRARTGRWPKRSDGPISEPDGDNWRAVDYALKKGNRGLPGGLTLANLIAQERRRRTRSNDCFNQDRETQARACDRQL